ncbi:protein BCAP isoform X2 [Anolis carolinensis]|uniref:Outer dense fiber of sperm tails 2 like n=1 Tax=Anolis carolinensis TaxID=28377 RepID=G1KYP9_ANOCA|nr:PREDICTED: outer dense fiber protein 2-like isoform X2 [Anolis carolinensis]|eukprot:XP_008107506.1 PREDICTED: outer dense fiber protein 2-like isoform X2 [Anolis carolinensis]
MLADASGMEGAKEAPAPLCFRARGSAMEGSGEIRTIPCLTSEEADRLCSVIESCDLSFKSDELGIETSSQLGKYMSSQNEEVDDSDNHLPGNTEVESLKEDWSSYDRLVDKHRTKMKELLPCLQGMPRDSSMEANSSEGETKWLWKDAINDKVTFQKRLHEAELAIGSAEMFLPSFKETLARISKIISKQIEELIHGITDNEMEIANIRSETTQKERRILELSSQLDQEKANVLTVSRRSESVQSVQTHLQCQIGKKEVENNQLKTKFQTVEKKIAEWKLQIREHKQHILAEKERREERKKALKRAASVQKQRAEHLKAVVESLISKIRDKEIQLSEVLSASNVWKSHHETVVDEKNRLEVQVESLEKQITDHMMDLRRIQDALSKSRNEILEKINVIVSENEKISLENATLKASLAALEMSVTSAEAEVVDLHIKKQQQEKQVERYKKEVVKREMEARELKTKYEKVLNESRMITEDIDNEMEAVRDQTEACLKDLERVRDTQKAAEGKLWTCQESLLSCQKSCLDKSKVIRELQVQVGDSGEFLKQLSLEEENCNIQLKYEELNRKLEEMELQNKQLQNQFANQEESLQKIEFQFKQKVADSEALTRQLEAVLEDRRKKLAEEMEKITSREQSLQLKILDLENALRKKKEEREQLTRRLDAREKHHELSLKELEHGLQRSEKQTQSIQNYVKFLRTSYVAMFS